MKTGDSHTLPDGRTGKIVDITHEGRVAVVEVEKVVTTTETVYVSIPEPIEEPSGDNPTSL
jgi:hypothetical protein